jgi:hypothetical protein
LTNFCLTVFSSAIALSSSLLHPSPHPFVSPVPSEVADFRMKFLSRLFLGRFGGVRSFEEGFRLFSLFAKAFNDIGLGFGFQMMGVTEFLDTFFLTCTQSKMKLLRSVAFQYIKRAARTEQFVV